MSFRAKKYSEIDYILIPLRVCGIATILYICFQLVVAFNPSILLLATSNFVDSAIEAFKVNDYELVYMPLILIMLTIAVSWLSGNILDLLQIKIQLRLKESFRTEVVAKRSRLKYKYVEDNDTWDLIYRATNSVDEQIYSGFITLLQAVQLIIQTASIVVILSTQALWAAVLIILFSLPLFFASFKSGKLDFEAHKISNTFRRRADYYQNVVLGRENAEERALFDYTDKMNANWFQRYEEARRINNKVSIRNFVHMKLASLITLVICFLIAVVLIFLLKDGVITIGMFMALINASFNLVQKMSWDLSGITKNMANNHQYLKSLNEFVRIEEQEGADDIPDLAKDIEGLVTIEFKNVSFKYPFTDKYILKNMSFKLRGDCHYAFVGRNGAGKTTVIKLLTGMYSEFEGDILINGKRIQEYKLAELKALFSIVYQDFCKYQISLKDNIMLGNVKESDEQKMKEALSAVGLCDMVDKLPDNTDTLLGKASSSGVDISGGQWQRIAIARSLMSAAPISVLDEPTASIDPVAEKKLYKLFGNICNKKLKIIITHRMGAAMLADEILVFDDGRIAEQGKHEDLVNLKGLYYNIYESQRRWYR